jgi:hypothetical protein
MMDCAATEKITSGEKSLDMERLRQYNRAFPRDACLSFDNINIAVFFGQMLGG